MLARVDPRSRVRVPRHGEGHEEEGPPRRGRGGRGEGPRPEGRRGPNERRPRPVVESSPSAAPPLAATDPGTPTESTSGETAAPRQRRRRRGPSRAATEGAVGASPEATAPAAVES